MQEEFERAEDLIATYDERLLRHLPEDAKLFDAHVHLGNDIDGMRGVYEELAHSLERYGIDHAFMFCMDEADRHPGFRAPNDRTLEYAERSAGRLIPFVRLDLTESPIEEAERCLDRGAGGIKLHPRAQRFLLNDERLAPIFALAAERRVPILIHGGRGLPPIADHLARLIDEYSEAQLIIAHAGIADLAGLAGRFAGRAGVFFDTSVWSPVDLLSFFHLVSPEQVLYASDYPYARPPSSLLNAVRTAKVAGFTEEQLSDLLGGTARRIASGEPPREPTKPVGDGTFTQPMTLARIHQYLSMATPLLWMNQPDSIGILGLALNACDDRDGYPEELDGIRELLLAARDLWRVFPEIEVEDRGDVARTTRHLIHIADIFAVTSSA